MKSAIVCLILVAISYAHVEMKAIYAHDVEMKENPTPTTQCVIPAKVQKPAPLFSAEAVVDGQFKHISLKDYLGKYLNCFLFQKIV